MSPTVGLVYNRVLKFIRFALKVRNKRAGHIPLLKEGPPRRSKIVMLPPVIGAAGVVSPLTECLMHVLPGDEQPNFK